MYIVHKSAEAFFHQGGETGCLLVHGFTGSPSEMRPLGNFLAGQGYTVLGVRLAGHGTDPKEMACTVWPDWYGSVLRGYEELARNCSRIFVGGLSMGGILALHLARENPVQGVITMNSPIYLVNRKAVFAPFLRHLMSFSQKEAPVNYPDHFAYTRMPVNCVHSLLRLIRLVKKELPALSCPLLVLQANVDKTVNPKSAAYIYEKIGSQDKTLHRFAKSGHLLTLGVEREQVFKQVFEFIKSHE